MPDRQRLLELALKGLESERARIDAEIGEIKGQLTPQSPATNNAKGGKLSTTPGKRTMSAEARRKISEAMKRRHAALKRQK